jgi:hypothetical protein
VEGEPDWLAYALANDADLAVDVNDEQYVFVFRKSGSQGKFWTKDFFWFRLIAALPVRGDK